MNEDTRDDGALEADLASLRAALREARAPDGGEAALLAAYRARLAARAPGLGAAAAAAPRSGRARAPYALAAAALLAAVTALVALRLERPERGSPAARAVDAREPAEPAAAFRPLAFARGVSAAESYSVVRVRLQLPASVPGAGASPDASIEADLLVGEDGLARAIRFDDADTLFVATVPKESGERR